MPRLPDTGWICDLTTSLEVLEGCSRGLTFDTGDPDYPYSLGGTCFLTRARGRYYALTARHCLSGKRPEQPLISIGQETASHLPIRRLTIPHAPPDQDPGAADIAFFEVAAERLNADQIRMLNPVPISPLLISEFYLRQGAPLVVVGYPSQVSGLDPFERIIERTCVSLLAEYDGPSVDPMCHRLIFSRRQEVSDYDGLSGGPVFRVVGTPQESRFVFAGLLVQGGHDVGLGHFIGCKAIVAMIIRLGNTSGMNAGSLDDVMSFGR